MEYDVGIVTTHVPPASGFGGVAVSGARLAEAWAGVSSIHIGLCSSNASEKDVISAEDVSLGANVSVWLYHAYWFKRWGFGLGAIPRLIDFCRRSRVLYLNGIATWPTTLGAIICCFFKRPFIVAPRGGLMPEHVAHIRLHKPAKWVFYRLLTFPWIKRSKGLHCTGKIEADGARAWVGKDMPVVIAPNGIAISPLPSSNPPSIEDKLILAYVGRISHEKGINTFLRNWLEAKRSGDTFVVAGFCPGGAEVSYFEEFRKIVAQANGAIEYRGYLGSSEVNKLIEDSHFLVLPSGLDGDIRENFGNAAVEALALGRPVIVCKGLEWDNIETKEAGFVFDRNSKAAFDVVRHVVKTTTKEDWFHMAEKARHYAEQRLDIRVTAKQVWNAIAGGPFSNGL
jgi:glycosyltransferase involved in cell wall biosynthesis